MKISAGKILISSPSSDDVLFDKSVIFITEYNEKGAMGFVLNKIFPRVFNELLEFKRSKSFTLYDGGPVENEKLYFLHRRPGKIEEGLVIIDNIYLGGNFEQAVGGINDGSLAETDIKLFIGYCGWDLGQLEEEMEEGSWLLCDADTTIVFGTAVDTLWEKLYDTME